MFKRIVSPALCATLGLFLASQGYVAGQQIKSRANAPVASVPGPDIPSPWELASVPGPDIPSPWEINSVPGPDIPSPWELTSVPGPDIPSPWEEIV